MVASSSLWWWSLVVAVFFSVSVLYSTETPFGYYNEGGVGEALAAWFP